MSIKKNNNQIVSLIKRYYLILSIVIILLLISTLAGYRLFIQKSTYVYVKVKVSQGLWWAVTAKPSIWYVSAIHEGDTAYDMFGKEKMKIISKRTYLSADKNDYDIYLTIRLVANVNNNTKTFTFNRDILSVGAPIELQFPNENITSTIIAVQKTPFKDKLIEKTIYLHKRFAYPWEYDAIRINSTLSDGENTIFTIIDKSMEETTNLAFDTYGNNTLNSNIETRGYIVIIGKVKVKQVGNTYVLGEDIILEPGRTLNLSLSSVALQDYIIGKIE